MKSKFGRTNAQRLILALILIGVGIIGRICLKELLPPGSSWCMFDMFAAVAVFALLAGCLLGGVFTFIVPISIMLISDIYLGNTYIFLFTWSGFTFVGLLGYALRNKVSYTPKFILSLTGTGILGVLVYDLWTNFGWWLGPFYPHTVEGLALCYLMALPFTLGHLISTLVVVPLVSIPAVYIYKYGLPKVDISISRVEKYVTMCTVIGLSISSFLVPAVIIG